MVGASPGAVAIGVGAGALPRPAKKPMPTAASTMAAKPLAHARRGTIRGGVALRTRSRKRSARVGLGFGARSEERRVGKGGGAARPPDDPRDALGVEAESTWGA